MKNKTYLNLYKKKFFGVTCHNSLNLAKEAILLNSSYVAFGAFFPSNTKKIKFVATKNILQKAKKLKTVIIAIGGITNRNYKNLLVCGANYIAISGFVWKNKEFNPLQALKLFK